MVLTEEHLAQGHRDNTFEMLPRYGIVQDGHIIFGNTKLVAIDDWHGGR